MNTKLMFSSQTDDWSTPKDFFDELDKEFNFNLDPSRTDTKWFHDYIYHRAEIRFIKGRLKFGGCKNSAPFPSMVIIYKK